MKPTQALGDKSAISLSLLCTIHCLALPLFSALLPSAAAIVLDDEVFHLWLVLGVVPISLCTLSMGCKKHKRYRVLILGGIGITVLAVSVLIDHHILGETWEKILTVVGASFIAAGHLMNYRICREIDKCPCPSSN